MPRRRHSRSPACGAGEDLIDYGEFKIDWREQVYIDHITKRNRLRDMLALLIDWSASIAAFAASGYVLTSAFVVEGLNRATS
jgi:hypothetical protein